MSHFSTKVQRFYEDFWTLVEPYHDTVMEIARVSKSGLLSETLVNIIRNIGMNFEYDTNLDLYGVEDYWESTDEIARARVGDCDGMAMLTSSVLYNLGIVHYLVIGHLYDQIWGLETTPEKAVGHVWVEVDDDKGITYILEPTNSSIYVLPTGDYSEVPYYPIDSIRIE